MLNGTVDRHSSGAIDRKSVKAITDSIDTKKVVWEGFCEEMTFELGLDFADPGRLRQRQRPGILVIAELF